MKNGQTQIFGWWPQFCKSNKPTLARQDAAGVLYHAKGMVIHLKNFATVPERERGDREERKREHTF